MPKNWALLAPQDLKLKPKEKLIISSNVRSARANKNELIDFISTVKPCILGIQETWGYNTKLQDYSFIANHRPKKGEKGGGVSITYQNSMKLKPALRIMSSDIAAVTGWKQLLVAINIYRPRKGNFQIFSNEVKKILTDLKNDTRKKILMGDFNIDFKVESRQSQLITDVCLDNDLIMPHKIQSRETEHSSTTIDGIFSNRKTTIGTGTFATTISDHYSPFIILNEISNPSLPEFITFPNTKPENIANIINELKLEKWSFAGQTVNVAYKN